jgi:lipopolysaccharide/colanic/teichoic acid biosynthesis glycosyltransferase
MGKRLLDITVSALLLLALLPLLLPLAIAISLADGGPPFYSQLRIGRGLKQFRMWKFRSMRVDADRIGGYSTETNDPRVTRIGRFIRRTSIDELPQLFNVFRGEMSLVGPRPLVTAQLQALAPEIAIMRHTLRPGMTGLAQISGRSALSDSDTLRLDLQYAASASLCQDLRILLATPAAVLGMRGTN